MNLCVYSYLQPSSNVFHLLKMLHWLNTHLVINQLLLLILMFVCFGLFLKCITNHTHVLENLSGLFRQGQSLTTARLCFGFCDCLLQASNLRNFVDVESRALWGKCFLL